MEVFLSELAENKLKKLSEYLLEEWGYQVKKEFLVKFSQKIEQIANQPESCPFSNEFEGIYKCVVTKQNTFYYRINDKKDEIEVITIFDTRQNLDKLKQQLD